VNNIEMEVSGVDLIDVTQNRDQWRALVNTVMNLWVPNNVGIFLLYSW
jgi:hypothetical protein